MLCNTAVSYAPTFDAAVAEIVAVARAALNKRRPDIAALFVSAHHAASYAEASQKICERLGAKAFIGMSGDYVMSDNIEINGMPGIALLTISAPGLKVAPFAVKSADVPGLDAPPDKWVKMVGGEVSAPDSMILLAEPATINAQKVLTGLDFAFPTARKIGALASGGEARVGANALFLNGEVYSEGLVGLAIEGVEIDSVVVNSCRPIGGPMVITDTGANVIYKMDGRTPRDALREIFDNADEDLRELMRANIMIGIASGQLNGEYYPGDFSIRNIVAVGAAEGSLAIGEEIYNGQVVQFHVMDPAAAREELEDAAALLAKDGVDKLAGALIFSCLTRGKRMFGDEGYEVGVFHNATRKTPTAGVFCNAQISSVGGAARLLGYTTVAALLSPTSAKKREARKLKQSGLLSGDNIVGDSSHRRK